MSHSKIDICNLALAALGEAPIRDFNENNKRARMCDIFYDSTAAYLLSKFDWSFARAYKTLQQLDLPVEEVPVGLYAYQLPDDCKTPREIAPLGSRDRWEVMADRVFTSKTEASLYYTKRDVIVTLYTDGFASLLYILLAVRMSPAITQDKNLTKVLYDQYLRERQDCWESDANIGNQYRQYDEDPNNDTFINPDLVTTVINAST